MVEFDSGDRSYNIVYRGSIISLKLSNFHPFLCYVETINKPILSVPKTLFSLLLF